MSTVPVSNPYATVIFTWETEFGSRTLHEHAALPQHRGSRGQADMPFPGVSIATPAYAEVNHGRLIARCPTAGCYGAEMVDLHHLEFFCCECRNWPTLHQPVVVVMPQDWHLIEAALLRRADYPTRNWKPGQSLDDLIAENIAHGLS